MWCPIAPAYLRGMTTCPIVRKEVPALAWPAEMQILLLARPAEMKAELPARPAGMQAELLAPAGGDADSVAGPVCPGGDACPFTSFTLAAANAR